MMKMMMLMMMTMTVMTVVMTFDNDPILQENQHAILNELGADKNSLVHQVMELWLKRRKPLIHGYCLVGYILAPQPTINQDATVRMTENTVYTDAVT